MNDLNSILIEGELAEDVWFGENKDGEKLAQVFLYSRRHFTYERETEMEQTTVKIVAKRNLAETIKGLKKGRRIRAVGRLRNERCMTGSQEVNWVVVCAEYIEIEPSRERLNNFSGLMFYQSLRAKVKTKIKHGRNEKRRLLSDLKATIRQLNLFFSLINYRIFAVCTAINWK